MLAIAVDVSLEIAAIDIVAAVLAILVVRRLIARQIARGRSFSAGTPARRP